jgi:predicted DNA-binding protein with PD1-like motif
MIKTCLTQNISIFMQARRDKTGWWLVLDRGEEVKRTIEAWAKKENIAGTSISGVGAVKDVELGVYSPEKKQMATRKLEGIYELLSLSGNINEDGLHAHIVISDHSFNAMGGHLIRATIAVFGEFFVIPTSPVGKNPDAETGLRKIDLKKK